VSRLTEDARRRHDRMDAIEAELRDRGDAGPRGDLALCRSPARDAVVTKRQTSAGVRLLSPNLFSREAQNQSCVVLQCVCLKHFFFSFFFCLD
jgi:hypothetical protein